MCSFLLNIPPIVHTIQKKSTIHPTTAKKHTQEQIVAPNLILFLKNPIRFSGNKGKIQAFSRYDLIIFLKNTNKISDNKEKGQVL